MTPIARAVIIAVSTLGFFGVQAFPYERFRAQDIPKQEDRWREGDWERGTARASPHATSRVLDVNETATNKPNIADAAAAGTR